MMHLKKCYAWYFLNLSIYQFFKKNQESRIESINKNFLKELYEVFTLFEEVFDELETCKRPSIQLAIPLYIAIEQINLLRRAYVIDTPTT